jgi:hypothetical protein
MAWGYGTTVKDTEVYEGPPDDPGITVEGINQGQIDLPPIPETFRHYTPPVTGGVNLGNKFSPEEITPEEPYIRASSSQPLNQQKFSDRFSFYLDDNQFGIRYDDSPFSANLNVGQGGQTNWEAQVGGGTGLLNTNVGIAGQGTSGSVSPFANINVNPLQGLMFNLHGQSYPGGYSELNPSASYQNQFDTPWGTVDYNIGRQGGRTVGGFNVRGDF